MSRSPILFDGGLNGIACDVFVRSVRQRALSDGREADDAWIAHAAAASLEGEALDWYEDQDDEVQESWKLLRRAMLKKWPTTRQNSASTSVAGASPVPAPPVSPAAPRQSSIPTPAAAPPSKAAPPPALPPRSPASTTFTPPPTNITGRIKVMHRGSGYHVGYVSSIRDPWGDYAVTQDISKAVRIQFSTSDQPHALHIVEGLNSTRCGQAIGINWTEMDRQEIANRLASGAPFWGTFSAVWYDPSSNSWISSSKDGGETRSLVWQVLYDGTIIPTWLTNNGARHCLEIGVIDETPKALDRGTLQVATSFAGLVNNLASAVVGYKLFPANLVFEPL